VVINRVNSIEDGLRTYQLLDKACREFLKFSPPLLGVIRQDTRVRDAIRNQTTIITRYPQSEAALDVMTIARRILQNEQFN
jgi:flagellar biosynthesis protein FlhG